MPVNDIVLESHEQRLQAVERAVAANSARDEADVLRFKMISDQIDTLGKNLATSIENLGKRVDGLSAQTGEHHKYLKALNDEHAKTAQRRKWLKRTFWGAMAAFFVALGEMVGDDLWQWVMKHLAHKAA
jgi:hypothetical protein